MGNRTPADDIDRELSKLRALVDALRQRVMATAADDVIAMTEIAQQLRTITGRVGRLEETMVAPGEAAVTADQLPTQLTAVADA